MGNRVIKFNAWDTSRDKMWSAEELGADEITINPDGRGFVNVSGVSNILSEYINHLIPLQFTEMLDKDKCELFDGDICEFIIYISREKFIEEYGSIRGALVIISKKNGMWGFEPLFPNDVYYSDSSRISNDSTDNREWSSFWDAEDGKMWDTEFFKKVGNIHENKEKTEHEAT